MKLLEFKSGNAKLDKSIFTFSLNAGHTCPMANNCFSKVMKNEETGKKKIVDGKNTKFRCFAATAESAFPNVYEGRKRNTDLLKNARTVERMANLINKSLPKFARYVRIHVSGDFFSRSYFNAWLQVAIENPDKVFYAYTKSLNFWVENIENIPENFRLTASKGGKVDHLISKHGLKYAEVVYSESEAIEKGLEIDHDDSLAIFSNISFALLLHGTQPKGTKAAEALKTLRKANKGGYSNKKTK